MAVQTPHYLSDLRCRQGWPAMAATAFSELRSELTSNGASGSRKRGRDQQDGLFYSSAAAEELKLAGADRRRRMLAASSCSPPPTKSWPAGGSGSGDAILPYLYHQSLEIDALIRLQGERIRSAVEEARRRDSMELLAALERRAAMCLREKDAELEAAVRRNADLEERVRRAAAESQIWFGVARNREAVASSLRSSLEQVLLRNAAAAAADESAAPEGFGDSGESPAAGDALSCCSGDPIAAETAGDPLPEAEMELLQRRRRECKACGVGCVSVLLLPCRHLCLCAECEPGIDTCPCCRSAKNGSLHVILS